MVLEAFSIALLGCSAAVIFLAVIGAASGWQVLRWWDIGSDSETQIGLEQRIWLAATLVQFGLIIELFSLILFVLAADYFSTILRGAMCAAGALTANAYGLPALGCKIAALFASGLWIVLHRIDIGSEHYPLTRLKCVWLLVLLPLLIGDGVLVYLYLSSLEPEIITSCCGVLFGETTGNGYSLLGHLAPGALLILVCIGLVLLIGVSLVLLIQPQGQYSILGLASWCAMCGWSFFYLLSLVVITVLVSPYVYALPHHRCPFDLLKAPYWLTGWPLYIFLHGAVLAGLGAGLLQLLNTGPHAGALAQAGSRRFVRRAVLLSLILLGAYLVVAVYHPLMYLLAGGER
jgi:hypothetical protein